MIGRKIGLYNLCDLIPSAVLALQRAAVQLPDVFLHPLLGPELGPAVAALPGLLPPAPLLLLVLGEVEQHGLGARVGLAALRAWTIIHLQKKNIF